MAPADTLSPPGSSSYSSDTMTVGDGTWDFTKNTFLLPNLVGLNFETMRYNGMGNRFSTIPEYHSLILGHGVLAAMTFLFIVPISVLIARFYTGQPGTAIRYHAYLHIIAVGLSTVIFVLGFIAVGPPRNLTNPHHGIGVAIYVLILVQALGGRLVRKLSGRSFRLHIHRWLGRAIALLGIVQVPLGLTLYGSPKVLFILYAIWMGFLLLLYFILDYRDYGRREFNRGRDRTPVGDESSRVTEKHGGKMKWLAPLAAGVGLMALLRGRKKHGDTERGLSRSPSPVDRSHRATVISSRRASDSYYYDDDEKHPPRRRESGGGGGFMSKLFAAGAGLGAGALVSKMIGRGDRRYDDEYSAVATDTPSRVRRHPARSEFTESEFTEMTEDVRRHPGRHDEESSVLPAPRRPGAGGRPPPRPTTPQRSRTATSRFESTLDGSDYSSYVSPSARTPEPRKSGGIGKGLLAGMGLGFLAKMGKDRHDRREEERLREEEEERRAGRRNSRYTGDGYPTPSRRASRRQSYRPPPSGVTMTETSVFSDESSIEPRGTSAYEPAPPGGRPTARPTAPGAYPGGGAAPAPAPPPPAPAPAPAPAADTATDYTSRYEGTEPVSMPPMPPDPHGILHRDSEASEAHTTPTSHRRRGSRDQSQNSAVNIHLRSDRGNITLRRLTSEEASGSGTRGRRRRADSVSSLSGNETPTGSGGRRYRRRDSSSRGKAEAAAEQRVETDTAAPPPSESTGDGLEPPNPAFARRRDGAGAGAGGNKNKDSAYYSGAGPSGGVPGPGATVSSLGGSPAPLAAPAPGAGLMSPGGSHATFTSGPLTDATAAADRRRRRRLERRDGSQQPPASVDFN